MDYYHIEEMIAELQQIDDILPQIVKELSDQPVVYAKNLLVVFNEFKAKVDNLTNNF